MLVGIHVLLQVVFPLISAMKVLQDETGSLYVLYPKRGVVAIVPNRETLKALGLDDAHVTTVNHHFLAKYRVSNLSIPSLKMDVRSRDDVMLFEIRKILSLSPPIFWKDTYYLGQMLNPTLETWKGRTLFAWRNGMYNSAINFAWFSFDKVAMLRSKVDENSLKGTNKDYPYFDVPYPSINIKEFEFNHLQEDPRLLTRHDGSLVVTYTAKESLFKPPKQCYSLLSLSTSGEVTASDSVLLDGHSLEPSQKNWITLEHGNDLYFIQSVNPLHVLQHQGSNGSDPHIGRLKTVFQASSEVPLPWMPVYGKMIRGGSSAVIVSPRHASHPLPQYYLAFFHSVAQFQPANPLRTYFMGAISFCPQPPFHVHAISTHPIVQERFYDGAWVQPGRTDYVMFATGILQRPDDSDHVYVSFGHQDKFGYMARFHVAELFASMEVVRNCTA